jgi:hypothetical protein
MPVANPAGFLDYEIRPRFRVFGIMAGHIFEQRHGADERDGIEIYSARDASSCSAPARQAVSIWAIQRGSSPATFQSGLPCSAPQKLDWRRGSGTRASISSSPWLSIHSR